MLSPSWPSPLTVRREVPERVRRLVNAAERRAIRRSVTFGAGLTSALLIVDLLANLVIGTVGIDRLAPFSVGAAAICAGGAVVARRGQLRAEPVGVAFLLVVFGVTLLGLTMTSSTRLLGAAQLATILVAVGLFLPWDRAWHVGSLLAMAAQAVAFAVSPLAAGFSRSEMSSLLIAVSLAAAISIVGHAVWQGRVRRMLTQQFILRELSRYAKRQEAHVTELNRELNQVARRDALTGIGNRLALDEAIGRLLDQGDRLRPQPFALALFDIDRFKDYNDEHGHLAGDAALGRLGDVLRRVTRGNDLAFRYGGEEFLLLLPDIELKAAMAVAERVRAAASRGAGGLPPFTISGGVALCDPADGRDPAPLLRRADAALYLAKRAGRDRIAADELSIAMQRAEVMSA